jgi:hypothetical protein
LSENKISEASNIEFKKSDFEVDLFFFSSIKSLRMCLVCEISAFNISFCSAAIKEGPPIFKEALDTFYIEVMGRMCCISMASYRQIVDAIIFRAVQRSSQQSLKKNNQADFFFKLRMSNDSP